MGRDLSFVASITELKGRIWEFCPYPGPGGGSKSGNPMRTSPVPQAPYGSYNTRLVLVLVGFLSAHYLWKFETLANCKSRSCRPGFSYDWKFFCVSRSFWLLVGICAREILLMFYANFTGEWFFFGNFWQLTEDVWNAFMFTLGASRRVQENRYFNNERVKAFSERE